MSKKNPDELIVYIIVGIMIISALFLVLVRIFNEIFSYSEIYNNNSILIFGIPLIIILISLLIFIVIICYKKRRDKIKNGIIKTNDNIVIPKQKTNVLEFQKKVISKSKPKKIIPMRNKKIIPICMICKLEIRSKQLVIECPYCYAIYHKEHLDEWLENNKNCPVCNCTIKKS